MGAWGPLGVGGLDGLAQEKHEVQDARVGVEARARTSQNTLSQYGNSIEPVLFCFFNARYVIPNSEI